MTSEDQQIIYYSFDDVPDNPDKQTPVDALKKICDMGQPNLNLEFVQSENSNIEIKLQRNPSFVHIGLATCSGVLFGILSSCILDISVGADNRNSNFIRNDENMVTNILMYEIGHSLGLGHTSDKNRPVHSTEPP